jgi:hypothetical protein
VPHSPDVQGTQSPALALSAVAVEVGLNLAPVPRGKARPRRLGGDGLTT